MYIYIYTHTVFIDIFGQIAQNALNSGLGVIVICPDALNDLGPASAKWPFDHPNGGHFSHLQRSQIKHPKGSQTAEPRIGFFVGEFICFTYNVHHISPEICCCNPEVKQSQRSFWWFSVHLRHRKDDWCEPTKCTFMYITISNFKSTLKI